MFSYDGASRLLSTKQYANRIDAGIMATLKAEASAPNFWPNPTNGLLWPAYNLTATASGTIDGVAATKFSVTTPAQWEAFTSNALTTLAGDVLSFTISMKGVGSIATNDFGIYGKRDRLGRKQRRGLCGHRLGPGNADPARRRPVTGSAAFRRPRRPGSRSPAPSFRTTPPRSIFT